MASVTPFDPTLHTGTSRRHCGQGGIDYCMSEPEFSVRSPRHVISACATHLAGAVRQAERRRRSR
jgi:hypothetical protein